MTGQLRGGKRELCLAECLLRVILRHDVNTVCTAEVIGECLGGFKSEDDGLPEWMLGIAVNVEQIRSLMLKQVGPCDVSYIRANAMQEWDWAPLITSMLNSGADLICTVSAGKLYCHERVDVGHAVVVEAISAGAIRVYDPGEQGVTEYSEDALYWAARARDGGLIVIQVNNE